MQSQQKCALALYDFDAEREYEITIKTQEGDKLVIINQMDDGWSEVKKEANGATGCVPTTYYEECDFTQDEPQPRGKKDPRQIKNDLKYNRVDATKILKDNLKTYLKYKRLRAYEDSAEFKTSRFRNERIREIYATEQDYVRHLTIMVNKYLEPLKASSNSKNSIINEQKHKAIFSNLSQILSVNQLLLADLKAEMEQWPNARIFACFKKVAPFLITYTTYINNYDNAFNTVTAELQKNQKFKDYCTQIQAEPETERHPITSFLIMPIQRLPRYKMLLEEMVQKNILPDDHVEKTALVDAYNKASTIATGVNERKRADENSQTLLQLSITLKSLVNNPYQSLVQPNRTLVREGVAKVRCTNRDFVIDEYKATLCTDVLILMQHNSKIKEKRRNTFLIFLSFATLRPGVDTSNDFSLDVVAGGQNITYTLVVPDPKEKKDWISDINECMETQRKANVLRLGNKNLDLIQVSPIRVAASDKVKHSSTTFQNLARDYQATEKKLSNLNEELRTNYNFVEKTTRGH
ncbi:myosin heavy chain [Acrasis kona]|uniref:Myosin heavy chain n=1 Tax=Acrasis kona TaxID=1008807 RepID=A0AAW2ZAV8_9EUKA